MIASLQVFMASSFAFGPCIARESNRLRCCCVLARCSFGRLWVLLGQWEGFFSKVFLRGIRGRLLGLVIFACKKGEVFTFVVFVISKTERYKKNE